MTNLKNGCEFHGEDALFIHSQVLHEDGEVEDRFRCKNCMDDFLKRMDLKQKTSDSLFFYHRFKGRPSGSGFSHEGGYLPEIRKWT